VETDGTVPKVVNTVLPMCRGIPLCDLPPVVSRMSRRSERGSSTRICANRGIREHIPIKPDWDAL
jgi:hypothetical protein